MKLRHGTQAECEALQALANKALGYPRRGTHVGGGRHCDMPDTWDGTGPVPLGWSTHAVTVYRNGASFSVAVPDETADAIDAQQARLTGPERAAWATAKAARVETPLDGWEPQVPQSSAQAAAARGQAT